MKRYVRIRTLAPIFAVALLTGLAPERAAQAEPETLYTPGASEIDEDGILRRMELELRQSITPAARTTARTAVEKEVAESTRPQTARLLLPVVISLAGGEVRAGELVLVRSEIAQPGAAGLPCTELSSIEFTEWRKLGALRSAEGGFLYGPVAAEVRLKNGAAQRIALQPDEWLRLNLTTRTGPAAVYGMFISPTEVEKPEPPADVARSIKFGEPGAAI
jgi:hypothetical protein